MEGKGSLELDYNQIARPKSHNFNLEVDQKDCQLLSRVPANSRSNSRFLVAWFTTERYANSTYKQKSQFARLRVVET